MSSKGKKSRRLLTLATSGVLLIALSACSGSSNNYGKLSDDVLNPYAKSGDYTVTEKELWDELKWSSVDVLKTQMENVVINKYVTNIQNVLTKDFTALSDTEKEALSVSDAEGFTKLQNQYKNRIVDYVIQDIYNFNFKVYSEDNTYQENLDLTAKDTKEKSLVSYVDETYTNYKISKIGETNLFELINNEDPYENKDKYLQIANDETLRQVYYSNYARELLAFAKKTESVKEDDEDDTDEDDDMWGHYSTSQYISSFKSNYTQTYDVNAILIKFTDNDEFNNTLRAFGIKIYNSKLHYIQDKQGQNMTYQEYIKYYDDFSNSQLDNIHNAGPIDNDGAILELYVQIYNYMYGGYRTKLSTGNVDMNGNEFNINNYDRNTLRELTGKIVEAYSNNDDYYENAVTYLKENFGKESNKDDATKVIYTAKDINKLSSTLKTVIYTNLKVDDKPYATSTTSASSGQVLSFKLGDLKKTTSKNYDYEEFYNTDLSDYQILDYIKETKGLKDDLEGKLITDEVTDENITTYVNEALEDVKVKIYNEACEIAYSISNSNYSRALTGNGNSNVLATIEYDGTTYNLNIKADPDDTKSIKVVGSDKAFGVYDYLEMQNGETTVIDILSKKIIKDTKAYEKTNEDRADYERYLQLMLLNFANGAYESSGYASTVGKYNFLMMYFHSADVDTIIDNYYRVQYASSKLLTNYASDDLVEFLNDYTDTAYNNYFSIGATRLLVYFDADDDAEADDINEWYDHVITADETDVNEFVGKTREYVARSLVYDIYKKVCSSTSSHSDALSSLVSEINSTAKIKYEENPIESENQWSKYRHLGLLVKTSDVTVTNSSLDVDFAIKARLYDYARGHNDDNTKTYQYFINGTAPTAYIESLTEESINNNDIVKSDDGYNLLLVTSGTSSPSAKLEEKDDKVKLLTDIIIKYNEEYVKIANVYNDFDRLNANQIKLYVLDYVVNGSSTLAPSEISDAITSFLAPAVTRYTAAETQRIILLSFIHNQTKAGTDALYDVITFAKKESNGADGALAKIITINQNIADNYLYLYKDKDTTNTSDLYPNWWEYIKEYVANFLQKEGE